MDLVGPLYDMFLLKGQPLIEQILVKMISLKEEEVMQIGDPDLLSYLRTDIFRECFQEYSLATLCEEEMPKQKKKLQAKPRLTYYFQN